MEKLIIIAPLILYFIGYHFGVAFSRLSIILLISLIVVLYPTHLIAISVIVSLLLTEYFLEKFYKQMQSLKRAYNENLSLVVNEMAALKKDSETIKLNLSSSEKAIKNILYIYELSKNIAGYVDLEKMFNLIVKSLDEQFTIKDISMKIFDRNKVFQKGTPLNLEENIKSQKIINNIIYLPLSIGEIFLGILAIKIPALYEKDTEFFDDIAAFVEELDIAIQRAILYSKVESMSRTDGLTDLHRRGYFNERLKEEEIRAKRWKGRFSILMMDIDHFKRVNDTYGHQAGDTVLKTIAGILKNSIYETDFAARYGGEEFVIIFPQTDPLGLNIKTEKIRKTIEETEITVGLERLKVTASFGIAHYPKDGLTSDEVLHKADMSLYKSKQTGRNKVTEYNSEIS